MTLAITSKAKEAAAIMAYKVTEQIGVPARLYDRLHRVDLSYDGPRPGTSAVIECHETGYRSTTYDPKRVKQRHRAEGPWGALGLPAIELVRLAHFLEPS